MNILFDVNIIDSFINSLDYDIVSPYISVLDRSIRVLDSILYFAKDKISEVNQALYRCNNGLSKCADKLSSVKSLLSKTSKTISVPYQVEKSVTLEDGSTSITYITKYKEEPNPLYKELESLKGYITSQINLLTSIKHELSDKYNIIDHYIRVLNDARDSLINLGNMLNVLKEQYYTHLMSLINKINKAKSALKYLKDSVYPFSNINDNGFMDTSFMQEYLKKLSSKIDLLQSASKRLNTKLSDNKRYWNDSRYDSFCNEVTDESNASLSITIKGLNEIYEGLSIMLDRANSYLNSDYHISLSQSTINYDEYDEDGLVGRVSISVTI